jgi:hypothetical protein
MLALANAVSNCAWELQRKNTKLIVIEKRLIMLRMNEFQSYPRLTTIFYIIDSRAGKLYIAFFRNIKFM